MALPAMVSLPLLYGKKNLVTLSTIYKDGTLCYTACEEVGYSWYLFRL